MAGSGALASEMDRLLEDYKFLVDSSGEGFGRRCSEFNVGSLDPVAIRKFRAWMMSNNSVSPSFSKPIDWDVLFDGILNKVHSQIDMQALVYKSKL